MKIKAKLVDRGKICMFLGYANGHVKHKFATLYGRMRVMTHGSGIKGIIRRRLWAEAANTATDLSNILVKYGESQSSFKFFLGRE